jgi:peptide deformylase
MSDEVKTEERGSEEEQRLEVEMLERREAALAQVVKFGDPVLKSKASPVANFGPELRAEVERMIEIMRDGLGVGLAATQLGVLRRLLVFQAGPDSEPTALINPEIEWLSAESAVAGLEARVLQHELDHLDGVLILDRTTREQRKGALRALREGGSYSPSSEEEIAEEGELREPRTDA